MSDFEAQVGQMLGRYELLVPIAKGGMGEVWAARWCGSRGFRRIVALKLVHRRTMLDPRIERMFIEEAAITAQIHHPNVVETIEFGEERDTLYLAMEWVEGETLSAIIRQANDRGGLPVAMSAHIVGEAGKGMHAAHELCDEAGNPLGLVHRDISPQNMIVSYRGVTKLLDFGVAKVTSKESNLTEVGELKGKFAYMSPEQLCGQPVDRRSDVFSLGVVLYMLTTGRHPFHSKANTPARRLGTFARPRRRCHQRSCSPRSHHDSPTCCSRRCASARKSASRPRSRW